MWVWMHCLGATCGASTWHIHAEVCSPRHGDHLGVVDGRVKGVHRERRRRVHDAVAGVQHAAHQQVYELVRAATHLQSCCATQPPLLQAVRKEKCGPTRQSETALWLSQSR